MVSIVGFLLQKEILNLIIVDHLVLAQLSVNPERCLSTHVIFRKTVVAEDKGHIINQQAIKYLGYWYAGAHLFPGLLQNFELLMVYQVVEFIDL